MMEIINMLSILDDILVVGGAILIATGETTWGIISMAIGLAIMAGKGEILSPIG
ncbi:MAG: hypothetical protein AABY04_04225 [Candidatus Micrarchaeota archaeon]